MNDLDKQLEILREQYKRALTTAEKESIKAKAQRLKLEYAEVSKRPSIQEMQRRLLEMAKEKRLQEMGR